MIQKLFLACLITATIFMTVGVCPAIADGLHEVVREAATVAQSAQELADKVTPIEKNETLTAAETQPLIADMKQLTQQVVELASNLEKAVPKASEIDILFKYLLLALLFEAVYAAIFQWSLFINIFDGTGARTVVKVGLAWIAIANYPGMNVIHDVAVNLFGSSESSAGIGQFITALLIAGGSSAIYDIMKRYLRDHAGLEKKKKRIEKAAQLANREKELEAKEQELAEAQKQLEAKITKLGG